MIVNINKEFAIRCQRKRISCNGFLPAGKYPANKIFPVFYEGIIFETDNALIVKYYSMMQF